MLGGFHEMDEHFRTAPFEQNLPVLMGLLAIWYNDFFGAQTVAVLPYEQYLKRFPAYLQQLTMESNGKHVTLDGEAVDVRHEPDLLGRARHQRPALVLSVDPSGHAAHPVRLHRLRPRRSIRSASTTTCCFRMSSRKAEALAFGKTPEEVKAEGSPDWLVPHRVFEGNRPSNTLLLERLTPAVARQAGRAVRTQCLHARARSGTSIRSTSGASSWARCSPSGSFRSSTARQNRRSSTTARPTP